MQVRVADIIVEDLSPVRFAKDAPPEPKFWAKTSKEAVRRGIDRLLHHMGDFVTVDKRRLPRNRKYHGTDFGWGDCGLTSIHVYEKIGRVQCQTTDKTATYTISISYCNRDEPAIQFTVPIDDQERAREIASAYLG